MAINFAEVIAQVKKAHGWKSKDLAKVLDVDPSTVSKWIRGEWNPHKEAAEKLLEMYHESMSPFDAPPEAPENLDTVVKKYIEKDEKTTLEIAEDYISKLDELEPTSFEKLNPPDISAIDQTPVQEGYARFLENLRFFMKDSRWDTDEKLETYLNLKPGYIDSFGSHGDRFEECKIMNEICDLLGVPWSILAFSNVAKQDRLARLTFRIDKLKEELADLIDDRNDLANELNVPEVDATIVPTFPNFNFIANSVENIKQSILDPFRKTEDS